jgi:PAS domain S-box-containing protein
LEILPLLGRDRYWQGESIATRKDGTTFPQELSLTLIDHDYLICICRDISDRKKAEIDLAESEAKFRNLVEGVNDVIWSSDADGIIKYLSPQFTTLFGWEVSEWLQRPFKDLIHLEDLDKILGQHIQMQNRQIESIEGHEFRHLCRDNSYIWVSINASAIFDLDNNFLGVRGIITNISDRKKAEQLLQEYNQILEREVADRTQQLSQALKELQLAQDQLVESRKMSALGTLVAGVAHEVNTPVGTSITVASSLIDKTSTLIAQVEQGQLKRADLNHYLDFARECSQMMLANLNRAAELVQNFKQVAVDTSQLDCRAICLVTYLKEVVFSLSPNFRHLGHQVTITGDETISIVTNSGALAQVVTNLTMNSIKHAYDEGTSGHLNFQVLQQKESVIIAYQDDGCGISPDNLKHIFEPFFTTARHRGGTGLGLHIVYNLVTQKLQGKIEVDSMVGRGSIFQLILPFKLKIEQ